MKAIFSQSPKLQHPLDSCLYEGMVYHSRFKPKVRHFGYRVCMVYFALDELEKIFELSPFWSNKKYALAAFRREDFHGDKQLSIADAVKQTVYAEMPECNIDRIFILANWRYWGYNMNPLTTYYCFDSNKQLRALLAEVNNTPWGERHGYVVPVNHSDGNTQHCFNKAFTVSPFNPLNMEYHWESNTPDNQLSIRIGTTQNNAAITDAKLQLYRKEISSSALNNMLIRYPFFTVKVIGAIYWQAFRLWASGSPFLGKNKIHSF